MPSRSTRVGKPSADPVPVEPVVTAYAWGGAEVDPAAPEALAKKSFDPTTRLTRYWLKRATVGPDRGHLFNPQSPTYRKGAERQNAAQMGKGAYEYRRATAAAFDLYLKFLAPPHNPSHLRNAERVSV